MSPELLAELRALFAIDWSDTFYEKLEGAGYVALDQDEVTLDYIATREHFPALFAWIDGERSHGHD